MRRIFLRMALVAAAFAGLFGQASAAGTDTASGPNLYLEQNGMKLRFIDRGQGEPLVLLHGYTMNADAWVRPPMGAPDKPPILSVLSSKFRVIAIDARGHGKSDKPHDCAAYGAAMADDVIRILDALHIHKAHLAGFSMGGLTAINLMARHPDRFRSVVLLAPKLELEENLVNGRDTGMNPIVRGLEQGEGLKPLFRAVTPAGAPGVSDSALEFQNKVMMQGQDAAALACVAKNFGGLAIKGAELDKVALPVLAIAGTLDPLMQGSKEITRRVRGSRLVPVDGASHITLLASPKVTAEMMTFFGANPIR